MNDSESDEFRDGLRGHDGKAAVASKSCEACCCGIGGAASAEAPRSSRAPALPIAQPRPSLRWFERMG
jgi:hypothetical protein